MPLYLYALVVIFFTSAHHSHIYRYRFTRKFDLISELIVTRMARIVFAFRIEVFLSLYTQNSTLTNGAISLFIHEIFTNTALIASGVGHFLGSRPHFLTAEW